MAASYPGSQDTFTTHSTGDVITAADINKIQEVIAAVMAELGNDPAGSAATVVARLLKSISAAGYTEWADVSTLTISGGSVTRVYNRHIFDTEASAAVDYLDTINGGSAGAVMTGRIANDGRNVIVTNAGNIVTPGGVSVLMDYTNQYVIFLYDSGLSKWIAHPASMPRLSIASPTTTYTALTTDQLILATGTFTITLPAVADSAGVEMTVKNISTGVITIDGAGAETIDGAANKVLYAQYDSVDLACNGTAWYIQDQKIAPAYAAIHVHDASTAQAIATGATYTKVTAFTDNGVSSNCTPDQANDKITITRPGKYQVEGSFSFSSGTNTVEFKMAVFINGVEFDNLHCTRKIGTAGDVGNAGITGIVDITSVPIDLDLRARHDNGGSVNLTVTYANLNVSLLGE